MGFAAEIKEFLGAAKDSWKLMNDTETKDADVKYKNVLTAEKQKEMDDPLNQKLKEAKLAHALATTANIGKSDPLKELQRQYWQNAIDAQKNPQETGPSTIAAPPSRPNIAASPPAVGSDEVPKIGGVFRKGGLVRKFADGGMIDDSDLEDDEGDGGALPPQAIPTSGTGLPVPATRSAQPAIGGVPMPKPRPPNPIDDALKYGVTQLPPQQGAIGMPGGSRTRALRGLAAGAGAAPPDDMVKIYRKIDPKGEMGESERNLYAIQTVWNYKMNQGDSEGAAKAAFQMLQHYKTAATRYAALTDAAMKGGNVDEGIKFALKAYAQVPDGNNMKLHMGKDGHINYSVWGKDEDGNPKELTGGIATPAEIGAAAMKLATPGGFEQHLVQMTSGAKLDTKGNVSVGAEGTGGGRGKKATNPDQSPDAPNAGEYKALKKEDVDEHVDKWAAAVKETPEFKAAGKEFTPQELASTKDMLYHIRRSNDVTNEEAMKRIQTIINSPTPTKKGDPLPFRAIENKDEKTYTIQFPDRGELTIPTSEIGAFKSARDEALKQRASEAEKVATEAKETAARGGKGKTMSALDKADDYFHKMGSDPDTPGDYDTPAVKGKTAVEKWIRDNPEMAARGRSAVNAGSRMLDDVNKWLGDEARSRPPTYEDIAKPAGKAIGAAADATSEAQKWLRDNPGATP